MLDRRFKHSLRIKNPFLLYKKYKKSGIFYVRFENGKTISTHSTNIQDAFEFAQNYLLKSPEQQLEQKYDVSKIIRTYYTPNSKWVKYDEIHGTKYNPKVLNQNCYACCKMADFLTDVKSFDKITKSRLHKLQEQLLSSGLSGKSVNNYIAILHKIFKQLLDKEIIQDDPFINLTNCSHTKKRRLCFSIDKFNHYFVNPENLDNFDLLAYCAIITGARRAELQNLKEEDIELYKNIYILRIHGTKSEYSDRTVPLSQNSALAIKLLIKNKIATNKRIRNCTKIIGERIGVSEDEIKKDGICFHSFRKMYKTILTSANLNTSLVEMLMGHSTNNQSSNNVERIYFVSDKADMSKVFDEVIKAFDFVLK